MDVNTDFEEPICIIGIGGLGSKILGKIDFSENKIIISNDLNDLKEFSNKIYVDLKLWINPSSQKIRYYAHQYFDKVLSVVDKFKTVILVSNLAGSSGVGMGYLLSNELKKMQKKVISIVVMPFGFEKEKLFYAGISFNKIRNSSDATIVIDNDAFLKNNVEESEEECYSITNAGIIDIIKLITTSSIEKKLYVLGGSDGQNNSLYDKTIDALSLFCNKDNSSVKHAILYVVGGKNSSLSSLNLIYNFVSQIFDNNDGGFSGMSMVTDSSSSSRVQILANLSSITKFDSYDPISKIIPSEKNLDFDYGDTLPDLPIELPNIE